MSNNGLHVQQSTNLVCLIVIDGMLKHSVDEVERLNKKWTKTHVQRTGNMHEQERIQKPLQIKN